MLVLLVARERYQESAVSRLMNRDADVMAQVAEFTGA